MFALNYNRRPTITYRRKPHIDTIPSSSDDDSDLDEPEKTRPPLQQYNASTISIVREFNTKLNQNAFEKKSSSSNSSSDDSQTADNHFQQPVSQEQAFHFIDESIIQVSSQIAPPAAVDAIPIPSIDTPSIAISPIIPSKAIHIDERIEIAPGNADPFIGLQDEEVITIDQDNVTDLAVPTSQTKLDMACEPPSLDIFDFPDLPIPVATSPPAPPPKAVAKPVFDIFDFPPEEDTGTVKLMVASRKHALKRSISQVAPAPGPPQRPPSVLKRSKSEIHGPKRVRFAMESLVSTFHRTSLDLSQPVAVPTAEDDNETGQVAPPPPPKQKRNLVSRLRGATGQASVPTLRQYNFDEDEDDGEELPVVDTAQKANENEQEHRQRMEHELAAIMENEFGGDEQENRARPQYQPKNAMNVRVTYQSKKSPLSSQQDREILELDNLLDRLRAGSSHL
ncbi:hypothetical protein BJV82DRAFT_600080 [Fennellomyces sp. T-0311]|nr:hypothetical protein BJV82DRAFT_600080 [Fennellomyces sp. T-0311]